MVKERTDSYIRLSSDLHTCTPRSVQTNMHRETQTDTKVEGVGIKGFGRSRGDERRQWGEGVRMVEAYYVQV